MLVERDELLPKTGQVVSPYAFFTAIAEAREAGDEAVIITVGAKLLAPTRVLVRHLPAPGGDVYGG